MSYVEIQEALASDGVQSWLTLEAANSTINRNSYLDNLDLMRQWLIDGNDPKNVGHITRMEHWLPEFEEGLTRKQEEQLIENTAFGALVFLSGCYRRQRVMQSVNQRDYFSRKAYWHHPYGINIPRFMTDCLKEHRIFGVTAQEVVAQGTTSLAVTQKSMEVIYNRVPEDFGKDISDSIDAINHEQESWLTFLSKVLSYGSVRLKVPVREVPILEPKPFGEAQRTNLLEVLFGHKTTRLA